MKLSINIMKEQTLIALLFGVVLLFLSAQICIPLQPVPVTLQTIAVLLIGLRFSPSTACLTVFTYLSLGFLGVPIFANFSGGIFHLLKASSGYLLGFLPAVYTMALIQKRFAHKAKSISINILSCLTGNVIIFICGLSWLAINIGFSPAIQAGLFPFILPGLIKTAILMSLLKIARY